MKLVFAAAILGIATFAAAPRAAEAAGPYRWCADYNNMTGNCGFDTWEQCREAASGNGGGCIENPRYNAPQPGHGRHGGAGDSPGS